MTADRAVRDAYVSDPRTSFLRPRLEEKTKYSDAPLGRCTIENTLNKKKKKKYCLPNKKVRSSEDGRSEGLTRRRIEPGLEECLALFLGSPRRLFLSPVLSCIHNIREIFGHGALSSCASSPVLHLSYNSPRQPPRELNFRLYGAPPYVWVTEPIIRGFCKLYARTCVPSVKYRLNNNSCRARQLSRPQSSIFISFLYTSPFGDEWPHRCVPGVSRREKRRTVCPTGNYVGVGVAR